MGGGGGGDQGGVVVGGPTPQAAITAGMLQSNAATEAMRYSNQALKESITAMNKMYQSARIDAQPYRSEGVQALNQLNQYLQLTPYNPGTAPTAVTLQGEKDKISRDQIRDYINTNSNIVGSTDPETNATSGFYQYTGAGSDNQDLLNKYQNTWTTATAAANGNKGASAYPGLITSVAPVGGLAASHAPGQIDAYGAYSQFSNDPLIEAAIRAELGQQAYDSKIEGYTKDLEEWTQNKNWYDQYNTEGPYSQQQIFDKISNLPGYQAQLTQGLDAINKQSSSKGYLGSGRLLKELNSYGQNTLSTFYGNELNRLAGLAGMGQQAALQSGQNALGNGQVQAGLYTQAGDTRANAALSSGNALAQALLAANQQYKIIGGGGGGGGDGGIGSALGAIGQIAGMFSSKELKDALETPSTEEILNKVNELQVDKWKYKNIERIHIGPYAEDLMNKLNVGNGQSVNLIDLVGVLFASVQELSKQIKDLQQINLRAVSNHG